MDRLYIFESRSSYQLFSILFPTQKENAIFWVDLFPDTNFPQSSINIEIEKIERILPEEEKKHVIEWLSVIRVMREGHVFSVEDVDFIFEGINRGKEYFILRNSIEAYLQPPLCFDSSWKKWKLIEMVKERNLSFPYRDQYIVVQERKSSFPFQEFCSALKRSEIGGQVFWEDWNTLSYPNQSFLEYKEGNRKQIPKFYFIEQGKFLTDFSNRLRKNFKNISSASSLVVMTEEEKLSHYIQWIASSVGKKTRILSEKEKCYQQEQIKKEITVFQAMMIIRNKEEIPILERQKYIDLIQDLHSKLFYIENWSEFLLKANLEEKINKKYLDVIENENLDIREEIEEGEINIIVSPIKLLPVWFPYPSILVIQEQKVKNQGIESFLSKEIVQNLYTRGVIPEQRNGRENISDTLGFWKKERSRATRFYLIGDSGKKEALLLLDKKQIREIKTKIGKKNFSVKEQEERIPKELIPKKLSAFNLNELSSCPEKFLFSQKLILDRNYDTYESIPILLGRLIHHILDEIFQVGGDLVEGKHFELNFLTIFNTHLSKILGNNYLDHPWYKVIKIQSLKMIQKIPEMEKQLDSVFQTQRRVTLNKRNVFAFQGFEITSSIDRIDIMDTGALLLIDYKTSNVTFSPDHISNGTDFQSLVNWLGVEQNFTCPIGGILFYDLRQGGIKRGIFIENKIPEGVKKWVTRGHVLCEEDWNILKEKGKKKIADLLGKIESGIFEASPSYETCEFCSFGGICQRKWGVEQ